MKVWTYFLLLKIFAFTKTTSTIVRRDNLKSVYLTQDTPEFNHKKYLRESKNSDNENDDNNVFKADMRATVDKTFTEFITGVIKILNTYGDTAFEDFFHIFDNEIRRYHYRGCKFSELTRNVDTRQFLTSILKIIKEQHVSDTRANINTLADTIKDETYDDNVKELLDYINFVYRHSGQKFAKVLKDLKDYRNSKSIRTHNKLQQVIRNGVKSILFDHYTQLDGYTRLELVNRIQTFWDQAKNNREPRANNNNAADIKPTVNSAKMIENFINVYLGPDAPKELANVEVLPSEETSESHEMSSKEPEKKGRSNKHEKLINYQSSELLSGQSFDTSSSIQKSHERHEMYNTQRYMTLFTEEVSYKATTRKTKIVLRAANVTRTPNKRSMTKYTTKYNIKDMPPVKLRAGKERKREYLDSASSQDMSDSNHDTESGMSFEMRYKRIAKSIPDKPQKRNKPTISKTTKNRGDAVKQTKSATAMKHPRVKLAHATTGSQYLYDRRKSLKQSKSYKSNDRTQIHKLKERVIPSNEGLSIESFKAEDLQKPVRRSGNDTTKEKDFNEYVVKRLDTLEKKIEELKQRNGVKIETANITENNETKIKNESTNGIKLPAVVKLHQDSGSRNIAMNTAASTKPNAVNTDVVNTTTIDDTNTTGEVTNNGTNVDNTEADKEITDNNVISTTENSVMATTVQSVDTTPTEQAPAAYSEPPPNEFYNPLDPFEHINDGLDLGM